MRSKDLSSCQSSHKSTLVFHKQKKETFLDQVCKSIANCCKNLKFIKSHCLSWNYYYMHFLIIFNHYSNITLESKGTFSGVWLNCFCLRTSSYRNIESSKIVFSGRISCELSNDRPCCDFCCNRDRLNLAFSKLLHQIFPHLHLEFQYLKDQLFEMLFSRWSFCIYIDIVHANLWYFQKDTYFCNKNKEKLCITFLRSLLKMITMLKLIILLRKSQKD